MYPFLVSLSLLCGGLGDLLNLAQSPVGPGLPGCWKLRPIRGRSAPSFAIGEADGERVLRVSGAGAAAFAYWDLTTPLPREAGVLRWSWRVLQAPASADLRLPKRDDSPLRIYVVFGTPGALAGSKGWAIFYTWGRDEPTGYAARSPLSDRIEVVRLAGATEVDGSWREVGAAPFDDFRRFWHRDPPPIRAVGVLQDTDATGEPALAELRRLRWTPDR